MSGPKFSSVCRVHIAIQELQAFALMPHRLAFQVSDKVVALSLDNSSAKVYSCNQGGTISLFLSRLACHILDLADKHSITLNTAYITTHLNVEANYLSWGMLVPEWYLPQITQATFQL